MKINNRRYIGCKTKMLNYISDVIGAYNFENGSVFADLFSGTGVVGGMFVEKGFKVIFNDTLKSNCIAYNAFYGEEILNVELMRNTIDFLNGVDSSTLEDNYFSKIYGGKYFSNEDAKKIGFVRDYIELNENSFNKREKDYLITSLIYATDKIANTVGHFESFLKNNPITKGVKLLELDCFNSRYANEIFNCDANEIAGKFEADVVYLDPPYNARQYVNFYHVIENLARWEKPTKFEGNSMKFERNSLKSDYCRKKAPQLFADLINKLNCKLIVVSYNNTYKAGSISSVNMISEEEIIKILSTKGKVYKKEFDYKAFNSGKTNLKNHKEYLYVCEVNIDEHSRLL